MTHVQPAGRVDQHGRTHARPVEPDGGGRMPGSRRACLRQTRLGVGRRQERRATARPRRPGRGCSGETTTGVAAETGSRAATTLPPPGDTGATSPGWATDWPSGARTFPIRPMPAGRDRNASPRGSVLGHPGASGHASACWGRKVMRPEAESTSISGAQPVSQRFRSRSADDTRPWAGAALPGGDPRLGPAPFGRGGRDQPGDGLPRDGRRTCASADAPTVGTSPARAGTCDRATGAGQST